MVHRQPAVRRYVRPATALGVLLVLAASTALLTYLALIESMRRAARSGPPQEFLVAATRQADLTAGSSSQVERQVGVPVSPASLTDTAYPAATPTLLVAIPSDWHTPTPFSAAPGRTSSSGFPEWVVVRYWISIPAIGVEAPIMPLDLREREIDGTPVRRLAVPDGYVVGWDETSAEPGFPGNTIMTGHNNLWGAVFGDLEKLQPGDEIAIWSEEGVFSFYVTDVILLEEEEQPLEVRLQNAQYIAPTSDIRLTLVTCWPRHGNSHRLIVIAKP